MRRGGTRATPQREVVVIVVAALAFSTSGPLGKLTGEIPAVAVAAARTGIASVVLGVVAPRVLARSVAALSWRERGFVLLAGALLGGHLALFLEGLQATSLPAAVALVSLEPAAVVIAAFLAFRLMPTRREILALAIATVGAVVVASGAGTGEHRLAGDGMVLGAVGLFGAYVASARGLRDAMPATPYASAVYGTAALVLVPLAVPLAAPLVDAPPPARAILAVLGLALVPTLIGHTLVQGAARHAPPVVVALVSPGETVGAIAIGAITIGAMPSLREATGAAIVIAGAVLAVTGRTDRASTPVT